MLNFWKACLRLWWKESGLQSLDGRNKLVRKEAFLLRRHQMLWWSIRRHQHNVKKRRNHTLTTKQCIVYSWLWRAGRLWEIILPACYWKFSFRTAAYYAGKGSNMAASQRAVTCGSLWAPPHWQTSSQQEGPTQSCSVFTPIQNMKKTHSLLSDTHENIPHVLNWFCENALCPMPHIHKVTKQAQQQLSKPTIICKVSPPQKEA